MIWDVIGGGIDGSFQAGGGPLEALEGIHVHLKAGQV